MPSSKASPEELSLFDFMPEASSIEEVARDIRTKPHKTSGIQELLRRASKYHQRNTSNLVTLTGDDQVEFEVLPQYTNLRPASFNDAVFLITDAQMHLMDARHVKSDDVPPSEAVGNLLKQVINHRACQFIIVMSDDLKVHHPEFFQAIKEMEPLADSANIRCLSKIQINLNDERFLPRFIENDTSQNRVAETTQDSVWTPPYFFTQKEEEAIRDYHFEKMMGKHMTPRKSKAPFEKRNKETDDAFYHLSKGVEWLSREEVYLITLDKKHTINGIHINTKGSIDSSLVNTTLMMEQMLQPNVDSGVFVHNHPSKSQMPSRYDFSISAKLQNLSKALGKPLYSVIVAGDACVDFTSEKTSAFYPQPNLSKGKQLSR